MSSLIIHPHQLKLALVHPQIAPNTGNIARLCVATGTPLHLVRPMGFVLTDKAVKRSAMDYWPRLNLTLHDDIDAFQSHVAGNSLWLFDSAGRTSIWDAPIRDNDWLVFGSESKGLPDALLTAHPHRVLRIPQVENERCLNLATSAGIALYEAFAPHFEIAVTARRFETVDANPSAIGQRGFGAQVGVIANTAGGFTFAAS